MRKVIYINIFDPGLAQSLALMNPQFTAHTNMLQLELLSWGSGTSDKLACEEVCLCVSDARSLSPQ